MAKVVLGVAAPHTTMLGKAPETWLEDGLRDRRNSELWYRNKTWNYEQLEAERRSQHLERYITVEERKQRFARARKAIDELRRVCAEVKPDLLVVVGKDQREIFAETTPTFAIHTADTIANGPPQRSLFAPEHAVTYPGAPDFAKHIIKSVQEDGFDIATIEKNPPNQWFKGAIIVPHAYSFVYHELMFDKPPPSVPVYMNTFFAPNQPTIDRSIKFGEAICRAIDSWDSSARVAIIGSGGLTHFVCDEELDRKFLDAFAKADLDALRAIDERSYQSGNSEVKLFVPIVSAMKKLNTPMTLVDYVPCYRTEAGTGEGCAFMYWRP